MSKDTREAFAPSESAARAGTHSSVTGISHQTASLALRERFTFQPDDLPKALTSLSSSLGGAAILSTCNRVELYLATPGRAATAAEAAAALAQARGEPPPEGHSFYHFEGVDAARHLCRVAAGVESLVIGEAEILGQVRAAFSVATAAGSTNPVLARLFHCAIRAGRRARSETRIGAHGLSVSATAVAVSRQALGDLRCKSVLVVGAGEAASLAAQAIVEAGADRLMITTRTFQRAREIAHALGGVARPFADLPAALAEADIVISSTFAPGFVIGREEVAAAMARRPERPLLIVDIAVPRDVHPAVAETPAVRLYDIDDLQAAVVNREAREREIAAVEAIVEDEVRRFQVWLSGRHSAPTIAALRRRAENVRRREVQRTLARLGHLSDADRRRIEAMSHALVKRILHEPTTRLRDSAAQRHIDAARELFGIDDLGV